MRPRLHAATERDVQQLWPAARADHLFDTAEQFATYCAAAPWHARVGARGEAAILGAWRPDLDVLAIRGLWCSSRHIADFVDDARSAARDLGLARVLSPLLPIQLLGPYCREGLVVCQRVVAIQGHLRAVLRTDPPIGVTIRPGRPEDLSAVERLETECFDTFWCYGKTELLEQVATDRLVVAETGEGRLVGYTLASVSRGAVALGRLGVGKAARRCGLGRALVAEVAQWAEESGAETISLCTQEENAPGRRLYRSVGLAEISDTYGLAIGSVAGER